MFNNFVVVMFAATCIWGWTLKRWIWFNDPTGHVQGQKRQLCPIFREFPILFSDTEVLHTNINGVESLSRSESSNLDLCNIFGLISQARYMLFSLPRELYNLITLHGQNSIIHTYHLAYFCGDMPIKEKAHQQIKKNI